MNARLELIRFSRPTGWLLLAYPGVLALVGAKNGIPDAWLLLVFVLGALLTRCLGCIFNDISDKDIDGHVARTNTRPLATGALSVRDAKVLALVLLIPAIALALTLNVFTQLLAVVALLLMWLYPKSKRYINAPQLVLALTFSMVVLMGYAATINALPLAAWVLFAANGCWVVAFDTIYAMADKQDDARLGVGSTALLFGDFVKPIVALWQCAALLLWGLWGMLNGFAIIWYLALLATALLFIVQLFKASGALVPTMQAFRLNNWVGVVLCVAAVVGVGG